MPRSLAVDSGKNRESMFVQSKVVNRDEGGGRVSIWTDSFEIYGHLRPLWTHERWRHLRLEQTVNYEIVTRYDESLTVGLRIRFGLRYFGVEGIINVEERDRMMILGCIEKADKDS